MTALLILSALVWAAEAQAQRMPPCYPRGTVASETGQRIMDAAARAQQREAQVFDEVARSTSERVNQAADCLSNVTRSVNEQIPSFGGGLLGSVTAALTQNLANQACGVVGRAQGQTPQAPGSFPGVMQAPMGSVLSGIPLPSGVQMPGSLPGSVPGATPGIAPPAAPAAPAGAVQSVGQLLSGLF